MRTSVTYRLIYLFIVITSYYLGFTFIPETTTTRLGLYPVIVASLIYFAVLPIFYWFMIIKAGKQKAWKIVIIFSLSCAVARYSYPEDIAQYFDFILWLRYPIMGVLLVIEFYLMFMIVKGLYQARNLSGDPRIGVLDKYDDDKKTGLALTLATEPASWYYAIPRLSKRHVKSLGKITLLSGKSGHFLVIISSLIIIASVSYQLLVDWSQTAAIMAASFILYGFILMTANYRLSRYYSFYVQDKKLIINNSIFNLMVIPFAYINTVSIHRAGEDKINHTEINSKGKNKSNELLKIGRSKQHNIKITFNQPIKYWGMMGAFVESFGQVLIKVEQPIVVINAFSEINSAQQQLAC